MTTPGIVDLEVLLKEEEDNELHKLIEALKKEPTEDNKYQWVNGRLLYRGRLVLSKKSTLIPTLLHTFHDSILGGRLGFSRTYKRISGELQ